MTDTGIEHFNEGKSGASNSPRMVTVEITKEAHDVLSELFDGDKITNESQAILGQLEFAQHLVGILNSLNEDTERLNAELSALKKEKDKRLLWLPS